MACFDGFNRLGLTAEAGWAHFRAGTAPPGHHVGASTGTSGNRGLYVISARERAQWLGTMLAKTLPHFPFERARVAVILPQNAALYRQPGRGSLLSLRFFDLHEGFDGLPGRLAAYRPDTLVAPPKVLRFLAEEARLPSVRRLFSGAEVLDPMDRGVIEGRFGVTLGEIYMATEGLLATTCRHGRLHLAEDVMHFELEPGPAGSGLVSPVISDFSRSAQIMARYRLNDLLRLSSSPCSCGSPLQAVEEVVGRNDDVLSFPSVEGRRRIAITPDILRNSILNAAQGLGDFRCMQVSEDALVVLLPPGTEDATRRAVEYALLALFQRLGARVLLHIEEKDLPPPIAKLRRVSRAFEEPGR